MTDQIKIFKAQIARMKEAEKEEDRTIKELKEEAKQAATALKDIRKDRGTEDCELRSKIDQCLKESGIDRAAHHGGDFTGVNCIQLEKRI